MALGPACAAGIQGGVIEGTRTPTFGTAIRIGRLHHSCCLSRRADDLRFFSTIGDRWWPRQPVRDPCDTDPARTEQRIWPGYGRAKVILSWIAAGRADRLVTPTAHTPGSSPPRAP